MQIFFLAFIYFPAFILFYFILFHFISFYFILFYLFGPSCVKQKREARIVNFCLGFNLGNEGKSCSLSVHLIGYTPRRWKWCHFFSNTLVIPAGIFISVILLMLPQELCSEMFPKSLHLDPASSSWGFWHTLKLLPLPCCHLICSLDLQAYSSPNSSAESTT